MAASVAIVADRLGWEEQKLIAAADRTGLTLKWVNDEELTVGPEGSTALDGYDAVLVRSRSYTRGGLLAEALSPHHRLVLNSASAIAVCENKLVTRTRLQSAIPVADYQLILTRKDFTHALSHFQTPVVFKPIFGGMGRRVTIIENLKSAQSIYDYVEDLGHAFEQAALVERFYGGPSVRVFVIGDSVEAVSRFTPGTGDWRSNAAIGSHQEGQSISADIRSITDEVLQVLGPGIFGVDLFETEDGYVLNEVNHAPAFRAVADSSGIDIAGAIVDYLASALT
ncbi:RimK family alpha-L-glutamate ligase (plasmid) [Rhodococcoides fascians A21d2]|uniref:ATP-grasp domain-containing protein n=1 Tax=Rhodococcoides fascians TaxID=1828 RepID=UPI00055E84F6|nr:RimK family alpha-L-glutamate ligase [Rhodococcus fascians]QII03703.1 RimK family alpha-L-glutamate ligase [Rhodococcus fascians A21d2]